MTNCGRKRPPRQGCGSTAPEHANDISVRTQYLAFIQQLPKEKRFDELREQAATKTGKWLGASEHANDTFVGHSIWPS